MLVIKSKLDFESGTWGLPINDQLIKDESGDSSFFELSVETGKTEPNRIDVASNFKNPTSHNDHRHKSQHNSQVEKANKQISIYLAK